MDENQRRELCCQLETADQSLGYLALLILSLCLSWRAVAEPVSYTHLDVYKRQG